MLAGDRYKYGPSLSPLLAYSNERASFLYETESVRDFTKVGTIDEFLNLVSCASHAGFDTIDDPPKVEEVNNDYFNIFCSCAAEYFSDPFIMHMAKTCDDMQFIVEFAIECAKHKSNNESLTFEYAKRVMADTIGYDEKMDISMFYRDKCRKIESLQHDLIVETDWRFLFTTEVKDPHPLETHRPKYLDPASQYVAHKYMVELERRALCCEIEKMQNVTRMPYKKGTPLPQYVAENIQNLRKRPVLVVE
jgi:hypothetical protein